MNAFEKLEDFDNQSLQAIIFNMVKWFDFDSVKIETHRREDVESRVWIYVSIAKNIETNECYGISGQRIDIVRRRLIEWLREYLRRQRTEDTSQTAPEGREEAEPNKKLRDEAQ